MVNDILTIVWKEWREILFQRGLSTSEKFARTAVALLVVVLLLSRAGPMMASNPGALVFPVIVLLQLLVAMVADSFAGERERHTLETLLASRLSDTAILIGKIMAAVLLMWALVVLALLLAFLGNSINGETSFPTAFVAPVLVFDLLLGILVGCTGVLVSLRASTVRQAIQILSFGFMGVFFALLYVSRTLPADWRNTLMNAMSRENVFQTELLAAGILILLSAAVFAVARMLFRRSRLLLD